MKDNIEREFERQACERAARRAAVNIRISLSETMHGVGRQFEQFGVSAAQAAEAMRGLARRMKELGPLPQEERFAMIITCRKYELSKPHTTKQTVIRLYRVFGVPIWWSRKVETVFV